MGPKIYPHQFPKSPPTIHKIPNPSLPLQSNPSQIYEVQSQPAQIPQNLMHQNERTHDGRNTSGGTQPAHKKSKHQRAAKRRSLKKSRELLFIEVSNFTGLQPEALRKKWRRMGEEEIWVLANGFVTEWSAPFHPLSARSVKEMVEEYLAEKSFFRRNTVRNGEFFLPSHRQTSDARGRGIQGKQVNSSSLPLCVLPYSFICSRYYRSHHQIPFVLSHASSFFTLQEGLPLVQKQDFLFRLKPGPLLCCLRKFKSHCSDSEFEGDDHENELYVGEMNADEKEVDRVCKVMEETFAFDRNMETVLDECGVDLSHELVLRVLERFKHARKPAFRFFCWACERRGFAHNWSTYNVMLSILGKSRQFETMVSVLEEMGDKDLLTIETFTICIKAFAAAKEGTKAVGILDLMKKFKFKVDAEVINCLLDALARAKLGKEAQVLFEKLEHRFTPNLCTYTVLLHGWCRVNNLMEAGRTWNGMIDNGFKPDIVAHNIMLEGLLENKKRSHAMELFGLMKSKGPYPSLRSYTVLIKDLCKHGNMQEAMEYLDEMLDSGCEPDAAVYTCLMTGFGNQKKMNVVYRLLKEMQEKGCPPDGRTYNALIKMMTSQHLPDDAAKIYKKMVLSNIQPSIHTYNMMMKSYFTTRNYEMGCAVWEEMKKKGCCPDENSYIILIRSLKRQGRSIEACRYGEEMKGKGMKAPQLDYKFTSDISRADRADILEVLTQKMKFC